MAQASHEQAGAVHATLPETPLARDPEPTDPGALSRLAQLRIFDERGKLLPMGRTEALLSEKPHKLGARLTLSESFDLRDLMTPDEALPLGDLRDLMAEIRSADLALARCAAMTEALKGKCKYDDHRASPLKDHETGYRLKGYYRIALDGGVGPLPENAKALSIKTEQVWKKFPFAGPYSADPSLPVYEDALTAALGFIPQTCAVVRGSAGNCFVERAEIAPGRSTDRETGLVEYWVDLRLTVGYLYPVEFSSLD